MTAVTELSARYDRIGLGAVGLADPTRSEG